MIKVPDQKAKEKMQRDGSVLKYMRDGGGLGKGLIAGGLVLLISMVLLVGLVGVLIEWSLSDFLVKGLLICAPGIILIIAGIYLRKSRLNNYLKGYAKASGLSKEEVQMMDQEIMDPDAVFFSLTKRLSNRDLKNAGIVTRNYVKMPGAFAFIYRINDLVACFYTKNLSPERYPSTKGFFLYGTDEKSGYTLYESIDEKACQELVQLLESRNPAIITAHQFQYEGKAYDCLENQREVIALHNRIVNAE